MKNYDAVVIGFGKGGKTLAAGLRKAGKTVALVERSAKMYGGTCINVACIPSKTLEHSARMSEAMGGSFQTKAARYGQAIAEKRQLTATLRQKNLDKLVAAGVEIYNGTASFQDPHTLQVSLPGGETEYLYGDTILINTGAAPFLPPIPGLKESRRVYTSETLMELDTLPKELIIVGGGYIGLEFASYYTNFGAEVTVLQDGDAFIPREDREVAQAVLDQMTDRKIKILRGVKVLALRDEGEKTLVTVETSSGSLGLAADAVLVATGRRPLVEGLNLEKAGVQLTQRGAIWTDSHLRTSAPHIYAMGDVVGGLQFTYISLDDSRIVKSALLGDGSRTTDNRGQVPYTVFLDPPLSRVGFSEEEALQAGYTVQIAKMPASAIPKAHVMRKPAGMLKMIIDQKTEKILGAHLFCAESQEMINLIKLAMDAGLSYKVLRDMIYNHPTMSEALNDLLSAL